MRGLDYYSKTAFEFESDEIGAKAAVAGGGRYDKLISYLGGKEGFGVGFAIGVERLMAILAQKEHTQKRSGVYLCALDSAFITRLFTLANSLRQRHKVHLSFEAKKLAKHLNLADLSGAKIFLCMGENEAKENKLFYKDLESKEERQIEIKNLENEL